MQQSCGVRNLALPFGRSIYKGPLNKNKAALTLWSTAKWKIWCDVQMHWWHFKGVRIPDIFYQSFLSFPCIVKTTTTQQNSNNTTKQQQQQQQQLRDNIFSKTIVLLNSSLFHAKTFLFETSALVCCVCVFFVFQHFLNFSHVTVQHLTLPREMKVLLVLKNMIL